jgi:signal peptidase I
VTSSDRDPFPVEDGSAEPDQDDQDGSRLSIFGGPPPRERRPRLAVWQESLLLIVLAVVVAVIVKQFLLQAFYIPSESMEPGLIDNDRILVEKPSYWFGGEPQRGDIVVFDDPGGWLDAEEIDQPGNVLTKGLSKIGLYPTGGHLVKRVIGVGGDTITCCDAHGRLSVNGQALNEQEYARPAGAECGHPGRPGACYGPMPGTAHWSVGPVPKGYVFVMGDNRANSADSTVHMCTARETDCAKNPFVPAHDVVGKVAALVWPLGRAHWEHRPSTFDHVPDPK